MSTSAAPSPTGPVTLINVVEIPAAQIDQFIAGWKNRVKVMSSQPGFVSATLHQALAAETRFQLVNVALWESKEALSEAMKDQQFSASTAATRTTLDVTTNPGLYRVAVDEVATSTAGSA